jgi:Hyaluronidase
MLQSLLVNKSSSSSGVAILVCGLLAVIGASSAPAVAQPTSTGPCFRMFDALLFTNKPDLRTEGIEPVTVIAPDRWLPTGQSHGQVPDASSIKIGVRATNPASRILVLDQEDWPVKGTTAVVSGSVNEYLTLLLRVRSVGFQGSIGYYGVPPVRDYWRALSPPNSQSYRAWQSENDLLQPLANAVDALFPSLYTFYDDYDGWTRYAIANLSEARRLAHGKPVYAFIWPQFHDSNKSIGLSLISGNFWALQLQTIAQYADGVIIWGGWRLPWDEQAEWWQSTRQFVSKQPQICKSPKAPSEIQTHQ